MRAVATRAGALGPALAPDGSPRILVGISGCLLGQPVRYDGGHKLDRHVTGVLGSYFEYVAFCPEALAGLGIPRPPIHLVGDPRAPRAVRVEDGSGDVTDALHAVARRETPGMAGLCGYIFKRGSPSCGMEGVEVHQAPGRSPLRGQGLFAQAIRRAYPSLPGEEEGRLNDPSLRESFVVRVYAYDRWQRAMADGFTPGGLVGFHTRHKLLLLSHSETHYRAAGRLVADSGRRDRSDLAREYLATFMQGLQHPATRRRQTNVLQHLAGYLKRRIDAKGRQALASIIEEYRSGAIPLAVPIRLLRHYFRHAPDRYVEMQYYLEPCPDALGSRNHL